MTALREVFARFTTRFDGGALNRGNQAVNSFTGRLTAGIGALRALGAAVAGLAIAQIIRSWISAAQEFVAEISGIGDELDKTSRVIGISSGSLQAWRHAANLSGVEATAFSQGLIRLQANMRNALITPTSSAALAFRRLGIEIRDADGNLRDADQILTDMADPINNLESSSERVAILTALMGRSGARMGPLFDQGRAGVEAMTGELEALGGGASQDMIQASADLVDAQARLDLAFLSIKSRLAVVLLPAVEAGVEAFTELVAWFGRHEEITQFLRVALIALIGTITFLVFSLVVISFPIWFTLLLVFGLVGGAIAAIVLVVQDLIVWFEGGNSVIGTFIEGLLALAGISLEGVRQQIRDSLETLRIGYNVIAEAIGLPTIGSAGGGGGAKRPGLRAPEGTPAGEAGGPNSAIRFLQNLQSRTDTLNGSDRAPIPTLAGGAGRGGNSVVQSNNFQISGSDPQAIASAVERVLDLQNRDAAEALGQ